jgi:hypothetical protein
LILEALPTADEGDEEGEGEEEEDFVVRFIL